VTHSSVKAEYVSASEATKQVVWLRKVLEDEKGFNYHFFGAHGAYLFIYV
jgi:hypothetical protein